MSEQEYYLILKSDYEVVEHALVTDGKQEIRVSTAQIFGYFHLSSILIPSREVARELFNH